MTFDEFCHDRRTYSATIREFIVIGEAISRLMSVLQARFPDYEWRMIKDFRSFEVQAHRKEEKVMIDDTHRFALMLILSPHIA